MVEAGGELDQPFLSIALATAASNACGDEFGSIHFDYARGSIVATKSGAGRGVVDRRKLGCPAKGRRIAIVSTLAGNGYHQLRVALCVPLRALRAP